jgi:hypothetical protein
MSFFALRNEIINSGSPRILLEPQICLIYGFPSDVSPKEHPKPTYLLTIYIAIVSMEVSTANPHVTCLEAPFCCYNDFNS